MIAVYLLLVLSALGIAFFALLVITKILANSIRESMP